MIEAIKIRLAAWQRYRETVRELSMLSNRELADLGIGRGDIPSVAQGDAPAAEPNLVLAAAAVSIGPAWAAHAPTSLAA